ncbi:MAG: sortase [Chloroflexota bacterium]|jgi:sortase A|nr:sortase [Chloroflexota bacterium]
MSVTSTGLVRSVAISLILAGLIMAGRIGLQVNQQAAQQSAQDKAWSNFVEAAAGQSNAEAAPPPTPGDELPANVYLKLTLPKVDRSMVAVNGDWNSLKVASMVHYRDSPAPGQKGNVLVAFHREPNWLDINRVGAGDEVKIQTLDKKVWTYKIEFVRTVSPRDVDLLKPTDGNDLTLITCDPPWQDYNRMLFRAHLVEAPPT